MPRSPIFTNTVCSSAAAGWPVWIGLPLYLQSLPACQPSDSTESTGSTTATVSSAAPDSETTDTADSTSGEGSTGEDAPSHDGQDASCGDGKPRPGIWCFDRIPAPGSSRPVEVGDFNGDDHVDILERIDQGFRIWSGDGEGGFPASIDFIVPAPWNVGIGFTLVGDFDGQFGIDIATLSTDDEEGKILVMKSDGTRMNFAPIVESTVDVTLIGGGTPPAVVVDLNGDSVLDLLGTDSPANASPVALRPLLNEGTGSFTTIDPALSHADFGPCQAAGFAPIPAIAGARAGVVGLGAYCNPPTPPAPLKIIRANAEGSVTYADGPVTGQDPQALAAGDFDGDTITDLILWNAGDRALAIHLGTPNGDFAGSAVSMDESALCKNCPCGACTTTMDAPLLLPVELDGDARTDILLVGDRVWAGMGALEASSTWVWTDSRPFLAADFNEDGLSDLLALSESKFELLLSNP